MVALSKTTKPSGLVSEGLTVRFLFCAHMHKISCVTALISQEVDVVPISISYRRFITDLGLSPLKAEA